MTHRRNAAPLAVVLAGCLLAGPSQAGGLYLTTYGTSSMGTASAGDGAIADDASTAFHNPAGMTRLDDTHVHIGMANAIGSLAFKVSDRTEPNPPPPGLGPFARFDGGGNIGTYLPLAGAFMTHEVTDRLRVGFAFAGMWGGAACQRSVKSPSNCLSISALNEPSLKRRATSYSSL